MSVRAHCTRFVWENRTWVCTYLNVLCHQLLIYQLREWYWWSVHTVYFWLIAYRRVSILALSICSKNYKDKMSFSLPRTSDLTGFVIQWMPPPLRYAAENTTRTEHWKFQWITLLSCVTRKQVWFSQWLVRTLQPSGTLSRVVSWKLSDVSELRTASITRTIARVTLKICIFRLTTVRTRFYFAGLSFLLCYICLFLLFFT